MLIIWTLILAAAVGGDFGRMDEDQEIEIGITWKIVLFIEYKW